MDELILYVSIIPISREAAGGGSVCQHPVGPSRRSRRCGGVAGCGAGVSAPALSSGGAAVQAYPRGHGVHARLRVAAQPPARPRYVGWAPVRLHMYERLGMNQLNYLHVLYIGVSVPTCRRSIKAVARYVYAVRLYSVQVYCQSFEAVHVQVYCQSYEAVHVQVYCTAVRPQCSAHRSLSIDSETYET